MKEIAKNTIYFIFYWLRNFLDPVFNFQEISALCYHSISDGRLSISPEDFKKQMEFLKNNHYYIATLDEITGFIKGEKKLPRKTVVLTFDDGYEDNFTNAFPILKKYSFPATFFPVSDFENARHNMEADDYLKPLLAEQTREMENSDLMSFQFHSKTHKLLDKISDGELSEEIKNKGNFLYFAYPGGHYSKEVIEAVKKADYKAAFSIKPGLIKKGDDLFLIKRNVIWEDMPFWQFKLRLTKAIDWYVCLIRLL